MEHVIQHFKESGYEQANQTNVASFVTQVQVQFHWQPSPPSSTQKPFNHFPDFIARLFIKEWPRFPSFEANKKVKFQSKGSKNNTDNVFGMISENE